MTNLVEFPGLGLTLNINRVAFTIFGLEVYWYGVIIVSGLILAVVYASTQCKRFGVDSDNMLSVVMVGLVCALIGLRLFYIAFDDTMTLADFFNFRDGGIAIYGGIIGAFLGAAVACRVWKVPVLPLFDLAGMGFLIGQSIGRWGNFFNQEAFGTNTTLPWGMISPTTTNYLLYREAALAAEGIVVDPYMPVHPTFLYESLWCALGFLLLFLYRKKRRFNGEIFLMYVMCYGLGRSWIEGLRTDSLVGVFGLRASQVLAIVSVLVAFGIWLAARIKTRGKPLVVPAVPDKVYTVKLPDGTAEKVAWPANTRQPGKEKLMELALARREQPEQGAADEAEEATAAQQPREADTPEGTQHQEEGTEDGADN